MALLSGSVVLGFLPAAALACSCAPDLYCERVPDPNNQLTAVFLGTVREFYPSSPAEMNQLLLDFRRTHPEPFAASGSDGRRRAGVSYDQEWRRQFIRFLWGDWLTPNEQQQIQAADQRELDRLMWDQRRRARFDVVENFSHANEPQFELITNLQGPSCGFDFAVGATYLVEAYRNAPDARWQVSSCRPPRLVSEATADLDALRAWKVGRTLPVHVSGEVVTGTPGISGAGLRLQLIGGKQPREAVADSAGRFEFSDLENTSYQLVWGEPELRRMAIDLRRASCARVTVMERR